MTAAESSSRWADKRDRWSDWPAFLWIGLVLFSIRGGEPASMRTRLIVSAVLFGLCALWAGSDWRERSAGVLVTVPMVAVGWLSIGLLPWGWALVPSLVVGAAVGAAFGVWLKRRSRPADEPNQPDQ